MKVKNVKFALSMAKFDPSAIADVPRIAVAGRSNVGKSSFINYFANTNGIAKTSSTPGKTKLLNFFEVNGGEFYLVDLPGYGFAKTSDAERRRWGAMIDGYLAEDERLCCVAVLVDIRHEPTALDKQMIAYLHHNAIPFFVVATKADKLSKERVRKQLRVIANAFAMGQADITPVSSSAKLGLEAVLSKMDVFLEEDPDSKPVDGALIESDRTT